MNPTLPEQCPKPLFPSACPHLFTITLIMGTGVPLTIEKSKQGYDLLECEYGKPGSICPLVQALLANRMKASLSQRDTVNR